MPGQSNYNGEGRKIRFLLSSSLAFAKALAKAGRKRGSRVDAQEGENCKTHLESNKYEFIINMIIQPRNGEHLKIRQSPVKIKLIEKENPTLPTTIYSNSTSF